MQHMVSPAKERQSIITQTSMKATLSTENVMARECINMQTEIGMKDSGRRTSDMVKEK